MAGYTRQSSFSDGDIISSSLFNNEYNQLLSAFNNLTGHKHDGSTAEGPVITLIGDTGLPTPLNKILIDTANDHLEFYVDVAGVSTQQFRVQDGAIVPIVDNDIDLGTSLLEFKDAYFDGTVNLDALVIGASTAITSVDTDLTSVSASDDTLASAKSIKTYVDAQDANIASDTLTFTNKTFNANGTGNSITNLEVADFASGVLDTDLTTVSATDNTLASAKAIKTYVDSAVSTANELSELTDVNITTPADGSVLFYDTATSKWIDNVVSGDITIADTGVAAISSGVIVNADVNASAAIAYSKLNLTNNIVNADINTSAAIDASKLADGSVSNTELQYINSLTSNAQTQLNNLNTLKAPLASPTFTGTVIAPTPTAGDNSTKVATTAFVTNAVALENELSEMNDVTITSVADADFLVYDSVSTKWENQAISGDVSITNTGLASINSGVIVNADINSNAAIDATKIHDGSISNTEFGYLNGVTSAIQTQINSKATPGFAVAMAIAL